MKKFKKFTASASAAALLGAGAMTAPTAFAQEEGSGESVTESTEGSLPSETEGDANSDASSELETSSDELSSNLEESAVSSDSAEGTEGEGSAEGLSSEEAPAEGEEGSSEEEQALLGVGVIAAIAGGITAFLPTIKDQLPPQLQQLIP